MSLDNYRLLCFKHSLNSISIFPGSSHGIKWDECSNQIPFFTGALTAFNQAAVGAEGVV